MSIQVAKGIGVAPRAFDGTQLERSSGLWLAYRHALLAALGRVALRWRLVVSARSCIVFRRSLWRHLWLLWLRRSPVAVVALRRAGRAARKAR